MPDEPNQRQAQIEQLRRFWVYKAVLARASLGISYIPIGFLLIFS